MSLLCLFRSLSWITYDHLDIPLEHREEKMWDMAAQELLNMDNKKTPSDKFQCMLQCSKIMMDFINLTSNSKNRGADDIFPLNIYILLKAKPTKF